jgi:hypothetical protein
MENEEELVSEIYDFLISQGCVNADTAFSMAELLNANMKKKRNLGHLAGKFHKHNKLITLLNRYSNEFGITFDDKGVPEGVYADPAARASRAELRHAEPRASRAEPRQSVVPLSMFLRPSFATDGVMSDPNRYTNPKSSDYNPFHMPYSPYVEGSQSFKHPEHMPRGPPPQGPSRSPHNPYVPGWYDDAMHPMHLRASAPPGGNKKSRCKPAKKSRSKRNASKTKKRK